MRRSTIRTLHETQTPQGPVFVMNVPHGPQVAVGWGESMTPEDRSFWQNVAVGGFAGVILILGLRLLRVIR